MCVEDPVVVLGCLLFYVERSKVAPVLYYAVVGPLVPDWGEEGVSNEFLVVRVAGGAATNTNGGRATLQKRRRLKEGTCDPTIGFPGENIIHHSPTIPTLVFTN